MKTANIHDAKRWFQVLQTAGRSQTAVMRLEGGAASGESLNTHKDSDQVLLVVEGEVDAEVGATHRRLRAGECVIVPAGAPHRFSNHGEAPALTFNVYSPPAY